MPQFKALYQRFSTQLGSKQPDALDGHFSPGVEVLYKGEKKAEGIPALKALFSEEWARSNANVQVKDIKELPEEDAVQIKAVDTSIGNTVYTTTYYYTNEGGEWKISKLDSDYDLAKN
ncbi:hypothetical protein PT974_08019 [Cladobotryum mycophilum]|uniref:Uncharacterized protein n=1 Tax=Cladobotryum mycophilum TaxID=491253 RepID=A0ABR0SC66_9HYPO